MVSAKRTFLSVTLPNNFLAYSFDKSVSFVKSDMSETFFYRWIIFDGVTANTRDYHLLVNQPVQYPACHRGFFCVLDSF